MSNRQSVHMNIPQRPNSVEMKSTLVRMSQTRHTLSRPPVMRTSRLGCSASAYTPLRWPWYCLMTWPDTDANEHKS